MTLDQYKKAFRKEVYALILDAYEESFTPGSDTVRKPSKPVTIKPDMYRQFAFIAVKKLARGGNEPPRGFSIESEQKEVFSHRGALVSNPSTPRMFAEAFDVDPFFARFFGVRKNPVAASSEQDFYQQFRASTQHVASLYFKRNGFSREKFEYPKGASKDQMKEVVLNQYRNYVFSGIVLALVKLAYEITPGKLDEILELAGIRGMSLEALASKATRLEFMKNLNLVMGSVIGDQKLADAVIAKVKDAKK